MQPISRNTPWINPRLIALACLLAFCVVLAAACGRSGGSGGGDQSRTYPYKVVTTVAMITDIVRQVAGDKAQVRGLMGEGVDPHLYKPSRADVADMMSADIVFYSGLMLEGKMGDNFVQISRKKPVHAVTETLDPKLLLEPEGMGGHYDPHVWMDVSAWSVCVENVAESLGKFDPANAEHYKKNAQAYRAELAKLHAWAKERMATIPEKGRVLITSHDAFNYFGRAYGVEVLGIQGLSTESEAGVHEVEKLVTLIVDRDVKAVFVETSVSEKNIRALVEGANARGKRVKIGGTLFSDAMGPGGTYEGTYIGMIDHNVTTVVRALGGEAPEKGWQGKLSGK